MFSAKKTRRIYQSPSTKVAGVDLEGLVCTSGHMTRYVDELHNINAEEDMDGVGTPTYLEF